MRVLIVGCGRVGGLLAAQMDANGHTVTVVDMDASAFRRLPAVFRGTALVGNGIDIDALRRAGIENTDAFVACTQGDNRNVMAAQIAKHVFSVPRVLCRIYDPIREEFYNKTLGLDTISPTTVGARLFREALEA